MDTQAHVEVENGGSDNPSTPTPPVNRTSVDPSPSSPLPTNFTSSSSSQQFFPNSNVTVANGGILISNSGTAHFHEDVYHHDNLRLGVPLLAAAPGLSNAVNPPFQPDSQFSIFKKPSSVDLSIFTADFAVRHPILWQSIAHEGLYISQTLTSVKLGAGTRLDILNQVRSYMYSDDGATLFLTGTVGTGKSAICKHVAEDFDKTRGCLAGAYFFHKKHSKNTLSHMIPTFAASLARLLPDYGVIVETHLQERGGVFTGSTSAMLWNELVVQPLQYLARIGSPGLDHQILFILDGLGECDPGLDHQILFILDGLGECDPGKVIGSQAELDYFLDLLPNFHLEFKSITLLISSRPTEILRRFLSQNANKVPGLVRINLDDDTYSHDVGNFVQKQLERMAFVEDSRASDRERDVVVVKEFIVGRAGGQFAYANQSLRFIGGISGSTLKQANLLLNDVATRRAAFYDLDQTYTEILQSASQFEGRKWQATQQKILYSFLNFDFPFSIRTLCMFWDLHTHDFRHALIPLLSVLIFRDDLGLDTPIGLSAPFHDFLSTRSNYIVSSRSFALVALTQSLKVAQAHDHFQFRNLINSKSPSDTMIFAAWLVVATKLAIGIEQNNAQDAIQRLIDFDLDHWLRWSPTVEIGLKGKYELFLNWLDKCGVAGVTNKFKGIYRLPGEPIFLKLPGGLLIDDGN